MCRQIESIQEIVDSKRENITKMAAQTITLRERSSECITSSQMADSRTAYALTLYAKISNITWDYKTSTTGQYCGSKCIMLKDFFTLLNQ